MWEPKIKRKEVAQVGPYPECIECMHFGICPETCSGSLGVKPLLLVDKSEERVSDILRGIREKEEKEKEERERTLLFVKNLKDGTRLIGTTHGETHFHEIVPGLGIGHITLQSTRKHYPIDNSSSVIDSLLPNWMKKKEKKPWEY